jgi:1-deoxy-D-xylulose-5-phosphate synthase
MGGYGSIVMELFGERRINTPIVRIGWPDAFIEHASSVNYLREKYGLTEDKAIAGVKSTLNGHAVQPALKIA